MPGQHRYPTYSAIKFHELSSKTKHLEWVICANRAIMYCPAAVTVFHNSLALPEAGHGWRWETAIHITSYASRCLRECKVKPRTQVGLRAHQFCTSIDESFHSIAANLRSFINEVEIIKDYFGTKCRSRTILMR